MRPLLSLGFTCASALVCLSSPTWAQSIQADVHARELAAQAAEQAAELADLVARQMAVQTASSSKSMLPVRSPAQTKEQTFQSRANFPELSVVQAVLATSDDNLDFANIEVAVERWIDPSVNEMATLHQLDQLADAARARFPQGDQTDPETKGMVLISTMRDAGPWNNNRPFSYDLDDPFGTNIHAKLLSSLLATRKGNCVSLPVLFVVLAQKLGLPATLSSAPQHMFAKFRKDDGTWINIELTSYGSLTDQKYIDRMHISQAAVDHHVWLRTQTPKQTAVQLMDVLVEHLHATKQWEKGLALTQMLREQDPVNPFLLTSRGSFFCQLSDQRYGGPSRQVSIQRLEDHDALEWNCALNFARAQELGWVPETSRDRADYLSTVQQVKQHQGE